MDSGGNLTHTPKASTSHIWRVPRPECHRGGDGTGPSAVNLQDLTVKFISGLTCHFFPNARSLL